MRSFFSHLLKLILILLILCGLFIALLPTIASTQWGNRQVEKWINSTIPGNIEIRRLDLHWGKGQVLEGILLKDPDGQSVLGIEKFSTDATLWQLLRKRTHLGLTQVQDFNAAIVTDEKGWTNLQRALGIPPSNDIPPLAPSTIILSDVNADLDLFTNQNPFSARIKGLTRQENLNGSFEINLSLNGLQGSDWEKLKQDAQNYLSIEGSKEAVIQARIVNFPVDLIDRLVALKNPHLNGFFHSILGDRVNLTIDKETSNEGLAFNLTALAPLMQGDIKGKIVQGVFTLQEPATFHFNLTPEFVNPFTHYRFELLNPSRLKVVLPILSFPLSFLDPEASVDPCLFGFKTDLTLPETELDVYPIGKLNIQSLQAHLDSPLCNKTVQLEVMGQAQQGKESFDIHFDSTLNKPKNLLDLVEHLRQNVQASLKISHLPLQLIPALKEHPEWLEQIGSHADAQIVLIPKGKEEWEASVSFQTPRLALREAQFRVNKELILKAPAQLTWTGKTDCLQSLLKSKEWLLAEPCGLQFNLKQFQLPLDNPRFAKFQAEAVIRHLLFPHFVSWGKMHIQDLTLKVEGQSLNQLSTQLKGQLALLNTEGHDSPLIRDPLKFNQTSQLKIGSDGTIEMPFAQFQVQNSVSNLQLEARLNSNQELELTQPIQLHYTLTPSALQTLSQLLAKEWPKLKEDTSFHLTISPTSFNLHSFDLSSLQLQGELFINHLILQDSIGDLPTLQEIVMPWGIDGRQNHFFATVKGAAYNQRNGKPSQISAQFQFWPKPGHYDLANTKAEIQMNFAGIPTSILNMIMTSHDLSPILGSIIDLNFKTFYDPSQEKPGYWDLKLDSAQFHVDGRFKADNAITLLDANKPATIRLTVTPESYSYLKKLLAIQDERKLAQPFTLSGQLSELYMPVQSSLFNRSQFDLQVSTTEMQWQDKATPPTQLKGYINSKNLLDQIHFSLQAHSTSPTLSLQGTVANLFDSQQKMRNWQAMRVKAKLQGEHLTPPLLQSLLLLSSEQTQKLRALFGDSFAFNASCQLENLTGPIQASAKGTQGEILLDGQVKQGILTLNRPLEGAVKMTPLFTQTFLAKNVPILGTAVGAENPIRFKIDHSQFACPLFPFQLDQAKIGKGTLDLGKVQFRNEGELSSFLNLIRSISDPYFTIWFTPLYFQLDQGVLTLKRLDLLVANMYSLASWGTVDLNQHKANLVIGLSAQSLRYAFGIQGLDEQYLLQIPLQSENGKVAIDKKKATARISSLIAQTQGGSTGKLLGNLLDLALSDNGEAAPAPTTQPFPWEGELASTPPKAKEQVNANSSAPTSSSQVSENPDGKKKKKHKHHADSNDPIKEIQEGAIQVLDQLFGQ